MLLENQTKENIGSWIVHHGQKISLDATAPSEFSVIDEAAKAANLLVRLGENEQSQISMDVVRAIAKSANLNPRYELDGLLSALEKRRLIERSEQNVEVLGINTRSALVHASDLFDESNPSKFEVASIQLAEEVSKSPVEAKLISEQIGDNFELTTNQAADLVRQSEQIGFIDAEGDEGSRILFNGHLFRRDNVTKATAVLNSLSSDEQSKLSEFDCLLKQNGCLPYAKSTEILGEELQKKVMAAALYDTHTVSNEKGENVFVTSPSAFHKFVDPMVDDSFDMAKSLVASLYYGMTRSPDERGHIHMIDLLLRKLISGYAVGPAPAIGQDYRVLEEHRVVQIIKDHRSYYPRFSMKLLKKDIGELALQVLQSGDANSTAVVKLPNAPMSGYEGPEKGRARIRKNQSARSKQQTLDVLDALRMNQRTSRYHG